MMHMMQRDLDRLPGPIQEKILKEVSIWPSAPLVGGFWIHFAFLRAGIAHMVAACDPRQEVTCWLFF